MANSMNFNGVDLSAYGLVITHSNIPDFKQQYDSQLIQDTSYGFKPKKPPKIISLEIAVLAATRILLDGYLDGIKSAIVTEIAKALKLDTIIGRYWNAKLTTFEGVYIITGMWEGMMVFQADDPMAYDNDETSSNHTLNVTDPKTIEEVTGGTGYIEPVYTLTAGELLTDKTILIKCINTDEELQWIGTVANGKELEIDVANWTVKNDSVASMSTVTGQFPRMKPNVTNQITVTGFGIKGSLNIKYRDSYL